MASQPPMLPYATAKPDRLLRWVWWFVWVEAALLTAAIGTGVAGDVYNHLHPISGPPRVSPIYNALFVAVALLWVVIIPMVLAAIVRHYRRAR